MPLFFAIFSIFSLQIGLCLFGYYEKQKLKSGQPYVENRSGWFVKS